jgi:Fe-S cluster assembly ATP-binding protein
MGRLEMVRFAVDADVYIDGKPVVKGFTISLYDNEIHVLMGPNGSGKSSLVKAIAGHERYKLKGKVLLDGEDITNLKVHEKALRGLAIALQEHPPLDGIRVGQLLTKIAKKFRGLDDVNAFKLVRDLMKNVGLDESLLMRYHMVELSGGEKKKIELIKILIMEPKVAILDEPDSGVDVDSLPRIAGMIYKLKMLGSGIILITHQLDMFDYLRPDRVHVMISGKKVAEGNAEILDKLREHGYSSFSSR